MLTGGQAAYPLLIGVDKARFTRKVRPGETLELRARLIRERAEKAIVTCAAEAYVEGEVALSCEITLALRYFFRKKPPRDFFFIRKS